MDLTELKARMRVRGEWKAYTEQLAAKVKCSPVYIDQIAAKFRKPSPRLAQKLAGADRKLTLEGLRPDIYGEPAQ